MKNIVCLYEYFNMENVAKFIMWKIFILAIILTILWAIYTYAIARHLFVEYRHKCGGGIIINEANASLNL